MIPLEKLSSVLADPGAAFPATNRGEPAHIWLSQAAFSRPNRLKRNVAGVGVCWVDLDLWHERSDVQLQRMAPPAALAKVLDVCRVKGIPLPSAVFWTGRGMVAKWYLAQPLGRSALPRWDAVQLWLAKALAPLGSDLLAKDACRILRLPGSVNPRAAGPHAQCVPLFARESFGEIARVCFDSLADQVLPLTRKEVTARKRVRSAQAGKTSSLPKKSRVGLAQGQLQDFRRLAVLVPTKKRTEGWSNAVVLLASASLAIAVEGSLERWDQELPALARELVPHWSTARTAAASSAIRARLAARSKGAEVSLFRFSHEKILDMLGARSHVAQLSTILSPEEARARKQLRDRKRYASRRKPTEAKGDELARQVLGLRHAGVRMADVAVQLGVNRTFAYTLYKRALVAAEVVSEIPPLYDGEALGGRGAESQVVESSQGTVGCSAGRSLGGDNPTERTSRALRSPIPAGRNSAKGHLRTKPSTPVRVQGRPRTGVPQAEDCSHGMPARTATSFAFSRYGSGDPPWP